MKLGVFFFGSRTELTGAGAVVRSFAENDNVFALNGVDTVRMYDLQPKPTTVSNSHNRKSFVKKLVNQLLKTSSWGSYYLIDKLYFGKGENVISKYFEKNNKDEDALIFHEIFTCVSYVEKCEACGIKVKPFILVLHTNGEVFKMLKTYYPKFANSRYEKLLENRVQSTFDKAKKIVFVSQLSREHFSSIYPKYKEKAKVVYNGISEATIDYAPSFDGNVHMITVGTVNARKNQRLLIEAIAKLKRDDIFLTVVGGGDKLEECKLLANELGVEKYIEFTGPRRDVDVLLEKANLFIMSSLDEGLPISAIEALRAKLPLILTDVGGNKELIRNNGILIQPTIDQISKAIEVIANNIDKQKEMSIESYSFFKEQFSVENMIKEYCKQINDII